MIKHLRVNGKAAPSMVDCSSAVFSFSSDGSTEQLYAVSLFEANGEQIAELVIGGGERFGFSFDVRLREGVFYTWVVSNGREAAKSTFCTAPAFRFPTVKPPLSASEPILFRYSLSVALHTREAFFCFQAEGKTAVLVNGERLGKPGRSSHGECAYMCCNLLPYLWYGAENTVELCLFGGRDTTLCGAIVLTDADEKRLIYAVDESWQVRTREGGLARAVRTRNDG